MQGGPRRGGGGDAGTVSNASTRCDNDHFQDFVERIIDVPVPDTNDCPSTQSQKLLSPLIALALLFRAMRLTIDLDNQSRLNASKVGSVRADGMLAPEFESLRAPSKPRPENSLGVCQFPSQRARMYERLGSHLSQFGPPISLPRRILSRINVVSVCRGCIGVRVGPLHRCAVPLAC